MSERPKLRKKESIPNGWNKSASAWITHMGQQGDELRSAVLDDIMVRLTKMGQPSLVVDIGCGEGRFCRILSSHGIKTIGIDPVQEFISHAKSVDIRGTYFVGVAEKINLPSNECDAAVFYLSLLDIDRLEDALTEAIRVVKPGGHIIMTNLASFSTSSALVGKKICAETGKAFDPIGPYLTRRQRWSEWNNIKVRNWHRPLSDYMNGFLKHGLVLTDFEESCIQRTSAAGDFNNEYFPHVVAMRWEKP